MGRPFFMEDIMKSISIGIEIYSNNDLENK